MLARAREERKLGISEVAEHLKYAARQIEALEADDYVRLPGTTFVRGMIRGYTKLVGIDPAPVLKALERRNIPAHATVDLRTQRIPFPDGNKRATRLYLSLSVIALLAIAAVLYEWHFAEAPPARVAVEVVPPAAKPAPDSDPGAPPGAGGSEPVTSLAQMAPEAQATPIASVVAAGGDFAPVKRDTSAGASRGRRIELEFQKESWVEIKDRDGRTLHSQLNPAGTHKVIEGLPPFSVIIGNAANVSVTYRDAPVDLRPYVKIEVARLTLE